MRLVYGILAALIAVAITLATTHKPKHVQYGISAKDEDMLGRA